ncbi:MAG: hypothetical protein PW735_12235 [Acidobacteriaceae bacterium]|nr:hypothetical protein [Acidobacteriaceae bacterium]
MARVWRRPTLTALEIGWRWLAGAPLLLAILFWGWEHRVALLSLAEELSQLTFFHPDRMAATLGNASARLLLMARGALVVFVPVALFWWTAVGTLGQMRLVRRFSPASRPRFAVTYGLRLMRSFCLLAVWSLWGDLTLFAARRTLRTSAMLGAEPNVLLFLAIVILLSLTLFVGWAALSWPFSLAIAAHAQDGLGVLASLRTAVRRREASAAALEIGLVLCIVKIALLVLAMTLSASPLPFSNHATEPFLMGWWGGVIVLYCAASDYFHTVRFVSLLRLFCEMPRA